MIRVLHVITDLEVGGAERMLEKVVTGDPNPEVSHEVLSLGGIGPVGATIRSQGIPVEACGWRGGSPVRGLRRLVRRIRRTDADVVQTWMYHADLFAGTAARLVGRTPVLWNVRHGALDWSSMKASTATVVRATVPASRWVPRRILCCSRASARVHEALGYPPQKLHVVENGFDLERFRFSASDRGRVRRELGIREEAAVVLTLGREDPQKDRSTFARAMRIVSEAVDPLHVVLAGRGLTPENTKIAERFRDFPPSARIHLLGEVSDVSALLSAADVLCSSSSHGEGFPNVLGEAMACERVCVATDVGDSARILGDVGVIVPPAEPEAMARHVQRLLGAPEERRRLGVAGRSRVRREFSIEAARGRYLAAWSEVLGSAGGGAA